MVPKFYHASMKQVIGSTASSIESRLWDSLTNLIWQKKHCGDCKRQSCVCILSPPFQPRKNGPWPWNTSLPKKEKSTQSVLSLSPRAGISFPIADPTFLISFVVLVSSSTWPTSLPSVSPVGRKQGPSVVAQKAHVQVNCPALTARWNMLAMGYGYTRLKQALSLLYVSTWLCCVFLGNFDTKMQWAKVFGLLLLLIGNRCHLLHSASCWV